MELNWKRFFAFFLAYTLGVCGWVFALCATAEIIAGGQCHIPMEDNK